VTVNPEKLFFCWTRNFSYFDILGIKICIWLDGFGEFIFLKRTIGITMGKRSLTGVYESI
jgi:hypothetical protein